MADYEFYPNENSLIMEYVPDNYIATQTSIISAINTGVYRIRRTFEISKKCSYKKISNDYGDGISVEIAKLKGDYFLLDKDIFGINNDIYFQRTISFKIQLFVASGGISVIKAIDRLIDEPIYITDKSNDVQNDVPVNSINIRIYRELIKRFPTRTEIDKYRNKRIASILDEYISGMGQFELAYEEYMNHRHYRHSNTVEVKSFGMENILPEMIRAREVIKKMLDGQVWENEWQLQVAEVIRLIYPQYITFKRELIVGNDGRHKKRPDFILVDAAGYVDILEIKSPHVSSLVSSSEYRYNYIASHDLSGAIMQIEKYEYCLNKEAEKAGSRIKEALGNDIPESLNIKVVNPQGMLLMGRSNMLNKKQLDDFELIKRQYKNIVDIMSYDDLLYRLDNIISQLK